MNQDFVDLLSALNAAEARFLVVGAFAVTFHSKPRATGDLDLWVEPGEENAARVVGALTSFGAPLRDIQERDFAAPDQVFQIGVPPRRIDLLTSLTGLTFSQAWETRAPGRLAGVDVFFIGRDALIRNKTAVGRPQDLADVQQLLPGSPAG